VKSDRPHLPNIKAVWLSPEGEFSLSVELDNKDRLLSLAFKAPEQSYWQSEFQQFCEKACGMQAREALAYPWHEGSRGSHAFSLPWLLFKRAIDEFKGSPSHDLLTGKNSSELICRCFGVHRSEIESFMHDFPDKGLKDITVATRAVAGCTSCRLDVIAVMERFSPKEYTPPPVAMKRRRYGQRTPAQMLLFLDGEVEKMREEGKWLGARVDWRGFAEEALYVAGIEDKRERLQLSELVGRVLGRGIRLLFLP
jgi:hypothetical protein